MQKNIKKVEDQSINNKQKNFLHYRKRHFHTNRIPFPALSGKKGSMTVEASLVLPIFMLAMVLILYMGMLIKCQDEVQGALTRVAREASAEYGATQNKALENIAYYQTKLAIYLEASVFKFSLLDSKLWNENEEIDLIITYRAKLPFRILGIKTPWFRQRVRTRAFVGVDTRDKKEEKATREVYVTETGHVYHFKKTCTYLTLSISQLQFGDVEGLRNESGGKYKPCEKCCKDVKTNAEKKIYITNYGDRYHVNRGCSGIQRSIQKITLAEVGKRTLCSKCGEEE